MDEEYWALFRATGAPLFYLLYRMERERMEQEERETKTAWNERSAELV